jgi:hypothetical protein
MTLQRIGRFHLRLLAPGDRYGLNDCLTHHGAPVLEFYDAAQSVEKFGPRGQFVSRYLVSTLREDQAALESRGLNLEGGVPVWRMTAAEVRDVFAYLDSLN